MREWTIYVRCATTDDIIGRYEVDDKTTLGALTEAVSSSMVKHNETDTLQGDLQLMRGTRNIVGYYESLYDLGLYNVADLTVTIARPHR